MDSVGAVSGAQSIRALEEAKKKGEDIYSIRKAPGISLEGATIWTFIDILHALSDRYRIHLAVVVTSGLDKVFSDKLRQGDVFVFNLS